MDTEEEVTEIIKNNEPIHQNDIVGAVYDVDRCSECGRINDSSEWGVQKSNVSSVLRSLMSRGKINYTKDWDVVWEG